MLMVRPFTESQSKMDFFKVFPTSKRKMLLFPKNVLLISTTLKITGIFWMFAATKETYQISLSQNPTRYFME